MTNPDRMPCLALSTAILLIVTACTSSQGSHSKHRLVSAIKQHYAAHATEEQGACRSPKIDTIMQQYLLERAAAGQEVMKVRYSYFDRHADMDANLDRIVHLSQPCGGIAEREFTLSQSPVGYQVMSMSGEQHEQESQR
jgi:hypothetical protein